MGVPCNRSGGSNFVAVLISFSIRVVRTNNQYKVRCVRPVSKVSVGVGVEVDDSVIVASHWYE